MYVDALFTQQSNK